MNDPTCGNCLQVIKPGDMVIPIGLEDDAQIIMSGEIILVHETCPPTASSEDPAQ